MPDNKNAIHHPGQGPLKTRLGSEERAFRAVSRKVAFCVLAAASVTAFFAAGYWWYQWAVTARTCIDTYVLRTATSALLDSGKARSVQDYLSGLDISSFSAMILALLFTRLAFTGMKNTLVNRHRDRESYFDHAYHRILFPPTFEQLCIRLGLLGTLLSFLLAAISQMGNLSDTPSVVRPATLEEQAAAVSREGTSNATSGDNVAASEAGRVTTNQLSSQMFLLLCASLVSTFVGTGAAYIVTPTLNWLNDRAVGRHQLREIDPAFAAEEFFRQIDRTSARLAQFDAATTGIAVSAERISVFEDAVRDAAEKLGELLSGVEEAVRLFETNNENGRTLNDSLARVERLSDRWATILGKLPRELEGTVATVSTAGNRLMHASIAARGAFSELRATAGTARKSLEKTEHRTMVNWRMLKEVRNALHDLAKSERTQTTQVTRLTDRSVQLSEALAGLTHEVEQLIVQFTEGNGSDGDVLRSLANMKRQLAGVRQAQAGTASRNDSRTRPWWRRLLD